MKKALFALHAFLFCAFLASARDDLPPPEEREVPPPPVVKDLRAELSGNQVVLTWTPAPDVIGDNAILRSEQPITAANFTEATKIATVPSTQTTFTDSLDPGKSYYYAILSRDDQGAYYEFFVPASNTLLIAVATEGSPSEAVPEAFTSFDAITREDAVIVTWERPSKGRNVLLYRSTLPFSGLASLAQAILVSGFADSGMPFVDYPVPGVPFFYAIVDEETVRKGTVSFTGGANTNASPVEIPVRYLKIQKTILSGMRPMPLPWLNPDRAAPVSPRRFTPRTERMIASLSKAAKTDVSIEKTPFIFRSDRESQVGGEEYALKKIVEAGFSARNWKDTVSELERFLSIRRSPEATARTRFYIGEACFLSGNYSRALKEFLLARDRYHTQSNEWIQYTLARMIVTSKPQ